MALGGFFGNLGQQVGQNILYKQEFDDKQANIDFKQQEVASMKMNALAKQQQMQTQKALGEYMQSESAKDASTFTDPAKAAQAYSNMANLARQSGDFASAEKLDDSAKGKLDQVKEAVQTQALQKKQKLEDLSDKAYEYEANPTPQNAAAIAQQAVAAGVDPTSIPAPGTAQWKAWVNNQKTAALSANEKANVVEKASEFQQRSEQRRQEHEDNEADRAARRRDTAALQSGIQDIRRQQLDIQRGNLALREKELGVKSSGGGKLTGQERRDSASLAGAAAESVRNIDNMSEFPVGSGSSPFVNLKDHGVLDSVAKAGTNAFTPEVDQMFQTSGAGLALQVNRVETLGGGRGGNQAQIDQLERQLIPQVSDKPMAKLYKIATSAEIVATRMRNQPPPQDPKLREEWDKNLAALDGIPKSKDVLHATLDPAQRKELIGLKGSYAQALNAIEKGRKKDDAETGPDLPGGIGEPGKVNLPPFPKGDAASGGLPSGWSVKVK